MALRLGDLAPDFTADSTVGTIRFHEYVEGSWATDGEDASIVPALSDEEAKSKFPAGWETLKPYLRRVKQPRSGS